MVKVMGWRPLLLTTCVWNVIASTAVADTKFIDLSGCSQGFAMPGTSLVSQQTRSLLECAKSCALNSACLAFNLCGAASAASSPPFVCHQMASWARNCSRLSPDSSCSFRQKDLSCVHGNVNQQNGQCDCLAGAYGDKCEMVIRDCQDGTLRGWTGDTPAVLLHPTDAPRPFLTRCHFDYGTSTISWRRPQCATNDMFITGNWESLRKQEGSCLQCCFIGLDNLYFMINQGIPYYLTVFVNHNNWGSWGKIFYANPQMTNDLGRYELILGSPSHGTGNLGDGFLPGGTKKFCTADNDCSGCAAAAGHAGWFDDTGATCKEVMSLGSSLQWIVSGSLKAVDQIIFELERI